MTKSTLEKAKSFLNQRNYCVAVEILEANLENHKDDFEYLITLAIACLYSGEFGNANRYFNLARKKRLNDTRLYLGQAVLLLRAGKVPDAISYYLDVLEIDPQNKTALSALDFIKEHGDYDTICRLIDTGKISMFYPPLGFNPLFLAKSVAVGLLAGLLFFACFVFFSQMQQRKMKIASSHPELLLSAIQKQHPAVPQSENEEATPPRYMLLDKQIIETYEKKALIYWQSGQKENSCRVELNRLLLSNASIDLKQKANLLLQNLHDLNFEEALKDNIDFEQAENDPFLYNGCFANWMGRISQKEDSPTSFILTVGDIEQKNIKGMMPIYLDENFAQKINMGFPLRVLVKIMQDENDKPFLQLKEYYQPKDATKL